MSAVAPASPSPAVRPQPVDATRLLYERHSSRILGYCLSLLGSREDAEDAVQQTFLNAQKGLRRGVVPEFELAWLFKIAKNVCSNRRASAWRRGRVETVRDLDVLQDVIASPERQEDLSIGELTHALAAIPERQRAALLLREWKGLSYAEIGAQLGVSVAAVETLLFRARRSLTEELEQKGTTRRAGALATLVSVLRWFVQGGAAPVKLAAATATVAALAVTPMVVRDHVAQAPPPVSPQQVIPARAADTRAAVTHVRVVKPATPKGATKPATPMAATQVEAPAVSAPSAPAVPHVNSPALAPVVTPPAAPVVPHGVISLPAPPVALPAVPAVTLPDLGVPAVSLPVQVPNLPVDLPKLP